MRILVVSSFYPPNYIGGYELACKEVVESLKKRRHEVCVLTSKYGAPIHDNESGTYRLLHTTFGKEIPGLKNFFPLFRREIKNKKIFRSFIKNYKPDVIYMWHISDVSISLAYEAQASGKPVAYYVFDHWVSDWTCDPFRNYWKYPLIKKAEIIGRKLLEILIRLFGFLPSEPLDLRYAQFASNYLFELPLESGHKNEDGEIICMGIDTNRFRFKKNEGKPHKILYVGQIVEHKGLITAVKAMQRIIDDYGNNIIFNIVGNYGSHEYGRNIYRRIMSSKYSANIGFKGFIPHERMNEIYLDHNILVFPSIWDEPFGNTILEAMSSGLAVVATGTGGSKEILKDEKNSLLFPPANDKECAIQILRLLKDRQLYDKIRLEGRRTVEEKFCFKETMDKIECSLLKSARNS